MSKQHDRKVPECRKCKTKEPKPSEILETLYWVRTYKDTSDSEILCLAENDKLHADWSFCSDLEVGKSIPDIFDYYCLDCFNKLPRPSGLSEMIFHHMWGDIDLNEDDEQEESDWKS